MGPGVPYAIGAKWAHPDRPAIALVGDGAMQMNGLAELITVAHYWPQWADPRLIVAVLHNNDLNQVTWEMRAMEGAPKFAESQTLPDVDYAGFARSLGLHGVNVDDPDELGPGLGRPRWPRTGPPCWTCAATRTCRRSRRTPPSTRSRPSPAAVLHGDEDAWGFVKQGVKQKVQQYLPGVEGRRVMSVAAAPRTAAAGGHRCADRPVRTQPVRADRRRRRDHRRPRSTCPTTAPASATR